MKLIPENEVDEAAFNFTESLNFSHKSMETKTMANRLDKSFKAGVTFTESKVHEYIKDLIIENQGLKLYKDNEARRFEELAIEFAKYLFSTEISKHTSMENSVKYIPSEFNLMKGNLIKNGKEMFNQFLKERNGKI